MSSPRQESSAISFGREGSRRASAFGECLLDWGRHWQGDRNTMTFPRLPDPFRHILWATALAAALGAAYSEMHVLQRGGHALAFYGLSRGALTGAVIGCILTSFDGFVLDGPLGAPLRRAPFAAHVTVKTVVYLGVILFGLKFGSTLFPAPGENGIEGARRAVLARRGVRVRLHGRREQPFLGRTCSSTSSPAAITRRGWNRECSCSSTWKGRRDWPSGSVPSPSTAWSSASSTTLRSRSSRRGGKSIGISAMS